MNAENYTIVFWNDWLVGCASTEKAAIAQALRDAESELLGYTEDDLRVVNGVTLTDQEPHDVDTIIYAGHDMGWLFDDADNNYDYAIRL